MEIEDGETFGFVFSDQTSDGIYLSGTVSMFGPYAALFVRGFGCGVPGVNPPVCDLSLNSAISFQGTATLTPIPGALPLFATGLGAIGLLGWRRKRKAQAVA